MFFTALFACVAAFSWAQGAMDEDTLVQDIRKLIDEGNLVVIEEEALGDDSEAGDFNISAMLIPSNDVYINNTAYNFSAVRFKLRGYENRYSEVYIDGINLNDPERGGFSYGLIGGLNDAMRNKDNINWFTPSTFAFGQIGGYSNINTTASSYAPGGKVSLAYTNRNYKTRAMATYATGLMDNGWAIAASAGYRWADEGYIEGTFYNSLGYMLAIEKVLNHQHSLSLTTLGSPTQRAQSSPNVQETMDLLDNNYYNSYWGWQNGKKRNSRIITVYEPTSILQHKFQIDRETKLTTALGYKYTMYGGTALNRKDAYDPRPDYYRELPSYKTSEYDKAVYTDLWQSNVQSVTQVNWDKMYEANRYLGGESDYIVEERHNDQQVISLSSVLNKQIDQIELVAGIDASTTKGMHYKTISDLLGGEYFLDTDPFAQRDEDSNPSIVSNPGDFAQNDLNHPNRQVRKGDRFGYDYDIHINAANAWIQNTHRYNKIDVYYGLKLGYSEFYRYGNMRNGRSPENSYGKGATHSFFNRSAKAGLIYKFTGSHLLVANLSYAYLPPLTSNAYVSERIKDDAIKGLSSEKVLSADIAYMFSTPIVRGKLAAFYTNFYDQMEKTVYYDNAANTLLNYTLSGVNKTNQGVEAGLDVKINSIFSLSMAGTVAEYIYTNNPTAVLSYENGLKEDKSETAYMKNVYVGATPQIAGTFGIHAFYKYWFFDANINGYDRTYVDPSPNHRTQSAVQGMRLVYDNGETEDWETAFRRVTAQEKFKGGFTVDLSIGKTLRIQRKYQLNFNLQLNNILNNTELKTGGFEQGRMDYGASSSTKNMNKFPNKYYYAQGFNVFAMVAFKF
ncbi:MAG: TonB-dependent receptor [Candidatus Symbiothrix sp.]|nr:TonB-dependent receptor [Candidatus Symbiothrix sp.]